MTKEKLDFNVLVADSNLNILVNRYYNITKIFVSYAEETIFLKYEKRKRENPIRISELQYLVNSHPKYDVVFVNDYFNTFKIENCWISNEFNITVKGRIS